MIIRHLLCHMISLRNVHTDHAHLTKECDSRSCDLENKSHLFFLNGSIFTLHLWNIIVFVCVCICISCSQLVLWQPTGGVRFRAKHVAATYFSKRRRTRRPLFSTLRCVFTATVVLLFVGSYLRDGSCLTGHMLLEAFNVPLWVSSAVWSLLDELKYLKRIWKILFKYLKKDQPPSWTYKPSSRFTCWASW